MAGTVPVARRCATAWYVNSWRWCCLGFSLRRERIGPALGGQTGMEPHPSRANRRNGRPKRTSFGKPLSPGLRSSSPATWGDKIFLTCYSGYALSEDEPGDPASLQLHVLALNRADGKIAWDNTVKPLPPVGEYRGFVALHGYASSTPATDGQSVFVFLGAPASTPTRSTGGSSGTRRWARTSIPGARPARRCLQETW